MKKFFLYFVLTFVTGSFIILSIPGLSPANNQEMILSDSIDNNFILNKIIITGNKVTKEEVILRELSFRENEKLSLKKLQEDVNKIYNLGLFTKVDVYPIPVEENRINLLINVEERFYILPVPIGGFKGGDLKKFWGGIDFKYQNFRGMNENIGVSFALGYEPFVSLSYFTPWIGKKSHFFGGVNAKYSIIENKSMYDSSGNSVLYEEDKIDNFTIDNLMLGILMGKFISKKSYFSLNPLFYYVKSSKYYKNVTLNSGGIDRYLAFNLEFSYDDRNLLEYTSYGLLFKVNYIRYGLFSNVFDANKTRIDARKYLDINFFEFYDFIYAFRFLNIISFGRDLPDYLKEYIGFSDYVRGWKNFVEKGDNKLCVYNELRFPLIRPDYIKGNKIPVLKKLPFFKDISYRYGLYLTLFFDAGAVWNKNEVLTKVKFLNGFGTGINLILPFSFVGRIELAYRNQNSKFIPQVNFNLNSSF